MSEENYLSLKDSISEGLLRDLILFGFLFVLVLSQDWYNPLLFIFPIITFAFSLFFKTLSSNKWRTQFNNTDKTQLIYNPFGSEINHANRLNFCALMQLILLFWLGAESYYHPQLIDNYFLFFEILFVFFFSFGFLWIFLDLWKFSGIEIILTETNLNSQGMKDKKILNTLDNLISYLKVKTFKSIILISFIVFITLNILNLVYSIMIFLNILDGFKFYLPGTGVENSEPIYLPYTLYAVLIVPPIVSIVFFIIVRKNIDVISKGKLDVILKPLPKNIQIKIRENLKLLNIKAKDVL